MSSRLRRRTGSDAALLRDDQKPEPKPLPVELVDVYGVIGGGAAAILSPGARQGTKPVVTHCAEMDDARPKRGRRATLEIILQEILI